MMLPALVMGMCLIGTDGEREAAAERFAPPSYDWMIAFEPGHLTGDAAVGRLIDGRATRLVVAAVMHELAQRADVLRALLADRRNGASSPPERGLLLVAETLLALPIPQLEALFVYGVPTPHARDHSPMVAHLQVGVDQQQEILSAVRGSMAGLLAQFTYYGHRAPCAIRSRRQPGVHAGAPSASATCCCCRRRHAPPMT
ncbi:MAG: hypothetical protein U1E76_01885 [Planctomycetota bacterium]